MAAIIRFDLDVSKMTVQDGCCTTVVVQNEIQTHQQTNGERPTFICNNFHDERASAVLGSRILILQYVFFHDCFTLSLTS